MFTLLFSYFVYFCSDHEEEERRQREKERRREEKRKDKKKTRESGGGVLDPMDPSSYSDVPRYIYNFEFSRQIQIFKN